MKMNKKTIILFIGVTILNIALIGFYLFSFNVVKKETEVANANTFALQEYQDQGENIALVKKIIKETKEGDTKLDNYFINEDKVVVFIETIESVGDTAGISVTLSGLRSDSKNTLSFSVGAEGSFRNLMHFLALMEYLPLPIDTEKAFLSKQGSSEDPLAPSGEWAGSFSFKLQGYMEE